MYEYRLEEGSYTVEVTKGKLYTPYRKDFNTGIIDMELKICLEELLDTKSMGLYSFDAHSHVSRDEVLDTGDLVSASNVMKGEDFNIFFAGSPYDHEVHLQYLNRNFTDTTSYREKFEDIIRQVGNESYILDIGNETVKCRYGHAFIMNYEQRPPFSKYYDEAYDGWCFDKSGEEPAYTISYMHEALLAEKCKNSVAAAAHPTSWWWHNGEFITNIFTTLGFEILAGSIDAMVVMGYQRDHRHYQELWFELLKNGYFLTGIAETDASFDRPPERFIEFKTFAAAGELSIDAVCRAVKSGNCIVTSGPVVLLTVNGRSPGSVLNYTKGDSFSLEIKAFRCCEAKLSKLQLIVNGSIFREYSVDDDKINIIDSIEVEEDSFVLVKCYDHAGNLAMTNPVYIRNATFTNIGYRSKVRVNVTREGKAAAGVYWLDDSSDRISFEGNINLRMAVSSVLMIEVDGQVKYVNLFLLPELQEIFHKLYSGGFNSDRRFEPGEVPAEEFRLSKIREILDDVQIEIRL